MKKIVLLFILLVIAGGAALYFGWIKIEPGTFKIAHSTITGTLNYPLESGNFYWLWQKLIPKTFYLYSVEKEPRRQNIETVFSLPGSDQLKDFGDFDFEVRTSIQYRLDFDSAKQLLHDGILSSFNDYFSQRIDLEIDEIVSNYLLESMIHFPESDERLDSSLLVVLKDKVEAKINEYARAHRLKDVSFTVTFITVPQLEVYRDALSRYTMYMETLYTIKEQELAIEYEKMKQQVEVDTEIERLRKYGELITQYPSLLKYLYIQEFSENAEVMLIPHDVTTGFPKMLEPEPKNQEAVKAVPPRKPGEKDEGVSERKLPQDTRTQESEERRLPSSKEEEKTSEKWYEALKFWKYLQKEH